MEELFRNFLLSLEKEMIINYLLILIQVIMWLIPLFISLIVYLIRINIQLKETNKDLKIDYKILEAIQGKKKK